MDVSSVALLWTPGQQAAGRRQGRDARTPGREGI
jgi:hypothetical protein